ncbi:MAG: zinc-dependent metalloprotease, partial [Propionibacteriaceae bacterium]|nr:zinc-dependent metalloprotease [Propionibacteriaceae bacterium]
DTAKRKAAAAGNPGTKSKVPLGDVASLADMWLDEEISFQALTSAPAAYDRQLWLEQTFPAWKSLLRPVATALVMAQQNMVPVLEQDAASQMWTPMIKMASNAMLGTQLGNSLGQLTSIVLSGSDSGLPLVPQPQVILLPENIAEFEAGLDQSSSDILLFLTLRETARQRLFAAAGWLGPGLLALIAHYADDITIDADVLQAELEERMRETDWSFNQGERPEKIFGAPLKSIFAPSRTPAQDEILERLETLLALIEGWVDDVMSQITKNRMPAAAALSEMMHRRSATGGPVQIALKTMVGIELRPRHTRDARNLWGAIRAKQGTEARDACWRHPDLLPTVTDLRDPLGFAERGSMPDSDADFDSALSKLLEESD